MLPFLATFIEIAILLLGLFMIGLILIQRGKGGGLSGAFGGVGGSSAFGSRAGDAFTRLTIYVATVWILLIMIEIRLVQPNINAAPPLPPSGPPVAPADLEKGIKEKADKEKADKEKADKEKADKEKADKEKADKDKEKGKAKDKADK